MEGNVKKYARATMTVNIFVDPANPKRLSKRTAFAGSSKPDDDAHLFTYDGKPGFQDNYSCDPDSADYDPANYNRCLTFLHERGIALEVPLAPLQSRRVRDRWPLLSAKLRLQIMRGLLNA